MENDTSLNLMSRRKHLGLLAKVAMGGMILPASEASAFFGFGPDNYADFIRELDLKYIRLDDLLESHYKVRGSVRNAIPPKSLWKNIRKALKVADMAAPHLGTKRVRIVSAYRSPSYNRQCPGANRASLHMRNLALDLRYDASPAKVVQVMKALRSKGAFRGGIGSYNSFTHIDGRGKNADW